MTRPDLESAVWERTPSFRRSMAHGKRLIVMGRSDQRFGETATEWVNLADLSDEDLNGILEAYST